MRKLLCAMLVLALLAVPVLAMSVSAGSAVSESIILSDLLPDSTSDIKTTDCEAKINKDGTLTVTITGNNPAMTITLANGSTLLTGNAVDLSKDAYVAVDFGTAGDIVISHMILHYTRKDKQASNTFADLYLQSMYSEDYKTYRKQMDDFKYDSSNPFPNGSSHYVVWDWGAYLNSNVEKNLFDNKLHQFVDIDIKFGDVSGGTQASTIGSQITFYTIAVVSDPNVKLGTTTPDPITPGTDDPEESDDESSEESADESGDESAVESSEESVEESVEESSEESVEESSEASVEESSEETSTVVESSAAEEEGSSSTGLIIGIIVAVVVVAGAAVGVVVVKKKKK